MKFGELFSSIEDHLISSYQNGIFEQEIKKFKKLVLENKDLTSVFYHYQSLKNTRSLDKDTAEIFIQESVKQIEENKKSVKKKLVEFWVKEIKTDNIYEDIDNLIYPDFTNLVECAHSKKRLISQLSEETEKKENINLPINSILKIANSTASNYISNLDENTQKELMSILTESEETLQKKYDEFKTNTINKLLDISKENTEDISSKIQETISTIEKETFDRINFVRLKNLYESL